MNTSQSRVLSVCVDKKGKGRRGGRRRAKEDGSITLQHERATLMTRHSPGRRKLTGGKDDVTK